MERREQQEREERYWYMLAFVVQCIGATLATFSLWPWVQPWPASFSAAAILAAWIIFFLVPWYGFRQSVAGRG